MVLERECGWRRGSVSGVREGVWVEKRISKWYWRGSVSGEEDQ